MKFSLHSLLLIVLLMGVHTFLFSQEESIETLNGKKITIVRPSYRYIGEKDFNESMNKQPNFGMYKDNYFITGIPLAGKINKHTADAKFQISIKQRLMKNILPYNTYLMLTYTQKSFWNIYEKSSPFIDLNYNPGIAIIRPILHDNKFKGIILFSLEHESNGKDSTASRDWNFVTLSGSVFFNEQITIQPKLWIGLPGKENKDLFDYRGYGSLTVAYRSRNDHMGFSATLNPSAKFLNTQFEVSFRASKKSNQFLFIQWFNGYGESLMDYNQHVSMFRVGICLKPFMKSVF
ncbi:MAG TPA: phospholipase [Porphyromonadaceae bacterium]|jgi:phospholipase A1|nr:phospholipase [Porphyromonadaceae bacterium]HBX20954.1 phospholipase [Porphyromonadaceae bacterium]HCM20538.1 phospholipase [Porphyromonadaceae bacterium]